MSTVQIIAYGTLMTGEPNHRYCRNAVYIQPCTITGTLYDTGWGFPAFVPGETGTVKVELIEIVRRQQHFPCRCAEPNAPEDRFCPTRADNCTRAG